MTHLQTSEHCVPSLWKNTAQKVYLHHVDVIAECLQSHFKHDLLGQVAATLKEHVAFHRSNLVVARELGGVHRCPDLIALKCIKDLLSQSEGQKTNITVTYLIRIKWGNVLTMLYNNKCVTFEYTSETAFHLLLGCWLS